MKRTPWIFFSCRLILLLFIAFLTYVAKDGTAALPTPLQWFGNYFVARPNLWIFGSATLVAVLEVADRVFGTLQFRKEKVQGILDHMVRELFQNKPKDHRCTLFRVARGYIVAPIVLYRALFHHEDTLLHLRSLPRNPFGKYLYVWARAKGSRNHRSCVAFRVYDRQDRACEGVAGRVWQSDVFEAHDLPSVSPTDVISINDLSALPDDHPVAKYARAGNVASLEQLKARDRFGRHFYGAVIESPKNQRKWGVVLVDSIDRDCPWPTSNKGRGPIKLKDFEKDFESFTVILSTVLT